MLLITYSDGFVNKSLFESKVEELTKNIRDIGVVSLNDCKGLVKDYYGSRVAEEYRLKSNKRSEIKNILNGITHVIVFWGGGDLCDLIYFSLLYDKAVKVVPVEITKVVNKDKNEKFDLYIGRGSPWGNPYAIGDNGMTRDEVIEKYREYFVSNILTDEKKRKELLSLKGKVLGCHCKPLACHGDVIANYLNSLDEEPPF